MSRLRAVLGIRNEVKRTMKAFIIGLCWGLLVSAGIAFALGGSYQLGRPRHIEFSYASGVLVITVDEDTTNRTLILSEGCGPTETRRITEYTFHYTTYTSTSHEEYLEQRTEWKVVPNYGK
jgi:hypothetical protein